MSNTPLCGLCNQPMPKGEEMFQYHGYSGACPETGVPEAEARAKKKELENASKV